MASSVPQPSQPNEFSNAYAKLKALIIANQFSPNEHLQVNYLAEHLAVGVTPTREALIRLSVEGLITVHAKRGFFAKILTVDELRQLYHLALSLLLYNVQTDRERREVRIEGGDIADALSGGQINRATALAVGIEQLHERIATMNGNAQMAKVIQNYNCRTRAVRLVSAGQAEKADAMAAYIRKMTTLLEVDDRDALVAELKQNFAAKSARAPELVKELAGQAHSADWTTHHFPSTRLACSQHGLSAGAG